MSEFIEELSSSNSERPIVNPASGAGVRLERHKVVQLERILKKFRVEGGRDLPCAAGEGLGAGEAAVGADGSSGNDRVPARVLAPHTDRDNGASRHP